MKDIQLDLQETETLLLQATRPMLRRLLEDKAKELKQKLVDLEKAQEQAPQEEPKKDKQLVYKTLTTFSYDQSSQNVKIYLTLANVGSLELSAISASFQKNAFEIKVHGLSGVNYQFVNKRVCEQIVPEGCKFV